MSIETISTGTGERHSALLGIGMAAALGVSLLVGLPLIAAPAGTPAIGIALPDSPIFAVAQTTPNVLMVLDNSNSMDEAASGAAVGSNSPDSKSQIARGVVKSMVSTYASKMNMGLMSYKQAAPIAGYLHNSPYDVSYDPANYDPAYAGGRKSATKRYRQLRPGTSEYVYYNVALPFYSNKNEGTLYCYSATASFDNGAETYPGGPWDSYECYGAKTGSSDASPATAGSGYASKIGNYTFSPTDSDLAQGILDFGQRAASYYVSRTWYVNSSPGRGYLEVPIRPLGVTQAAELNAKLDCNVPGDPSPCTAAGIKNAGLTPIEGTLLTAKDYFGGTLSQASEGYTATTYPLPATCGRNYVILLTDGLPSTDKNGNALTNPAAAIAAAAAAAAQLKAAGVVTYVVGFALPVGTDPSTLNQIAMAGGTTTAYSASDQATLDAALKGIFDEIYFKSASSGATTANSTGLSTDTRIYNASFNTTNWSGTLKGYTVDATTGVSATPSWDATIPAASSRKIYTWNGSARVEFTWATMPAAQKTALGSAEVVDYLRGDRLKEGTGTFRTRGSVLGDIIHSAPVYIKEFDEGTGKPAMELIAIGANDGMLHLFDVVSQTEKFAYVPAGIDFANLKSYTQTGYSHKYFVDGMIDITSRVDGDGKNILVATLGRGGRGAFALDITNPNDVKVLWDKTGTAAPDGMGHVIGQPFLARAKTGTVSAFIPNGITKPGELYDGTDKPSLFVLDADTGASVFSRIDANDTTDIAGVSSGLSSPRGWDADGDDIVDYVYAGDFRGNVWKFDLTGNNASVKRVFVAETGTGGSAKRQPITGGISVSLNPADFSTWIHFGTGRFLTALDLADKSTQSIYGIRDEDSNSVLKRSDLQARSFASNGTVGSFSVRVLADYANLPGTKKGWYIDLLDPPSDTQQGERVVGTPQEVAAELRVSTGIPGATLCDPISGGYLYSIAAFTGTSTSVQMLDLNRDGKIDDSDKSGGKVAGGVSLGIGLVGDSTQTGGMLTAGGTKGAASGVGGSLASVGTKINHVAGRVAWREIVND